MHERDGQTDTGRQPRLRIASRGKHRASVPSLLQYWLLYTDDHDQHPHTGLTGSRPGNYRDRRVKRNRLSGITHTRRYKTLPLKQTVNELLYCTRGGTTQQLQTTESIGTKIMHAAFSPVRNATSLTVMHQRTCTILFNADRTLNALNDAERKFKQGANNTVKLWQCTRCDSAHVYTETFLYGPPCT